MNACRIVFVVCKSMCLYNLCVCFNSMKGIVLLSLRLGMVMEQDW
jgi:hypothetical protein